MSENEKNKSGEWNDLKDKKMEDLTNEELKELNGWRFNGIPEKFIPSSEKPEQYVSAITEVLLATTNIRTGKQID